MDYYGLLGLLGITRDYYGLLGITRDYQGLLWITRDYQGLLGITGRNLASGVLAAKILRLFHGYLAAAPPIIGILHGNSES